MVANTTVGTGMVVCVRVGEAGIDTVVGVVNEGVHAHRLSHRMIETSRLNLLIRLTLISIPLTRLFNFMLQPGYSC